MRRQAALAPDAPYLVTERGVFTFGEWDERVDRAAGRLAARGVGVGTRVAALLAGDTAWVELVWALIRLRATLVPINARLSDREAGALMADVDPALAIVEPARAGGLRSVFAGPTLVVDPDQGLADDPPIADEWRLRAGEPAPTDLQSIIFTSGTTGRPKGALVRLEQHWWNAVGSMLRLGEARDDAWLLAMPLYHVGGQAILFRAAIGGHAVHLHPRFDAPAIAAALDGDGITLASLVPTMLSRVLDAHPGVFRGRLRALLIGGAPCPPHLVRRARAQHLPVVLTYGMTETASQMTTQALGSGTVDAGSPLWAVSLRVAVDQPDGSGEIQVRGPQVVAGYWGEPPGDLAHFTADGWFRTGDVGRLGADGSLTVLDRRGDLIISGGENVYPAEVEAVVASHPAVSAAAVAPWPDPEWGQVVAAWIVTAEVVTDEALTEYCRTAMAAYKVPRHWFRVAELPVTANGKVRRNHLASLVGTGP